MRTKTPATRSRNRPEKNPSHSLNPVYPSASNLPVPYTASKDIEGITQKHDLQTLGNLRAPAIGFLSALLEHITHSKALEETGLKWSDLNHWRLLCPGYDDLYREVKTMVDEKKAQHLEDRAYERGDKGAIVEAGRYAPSDAMTKMVLGAILPGKYGRDLEGQAQAVQVNINI